MKKLILLFLVVAKCSAVEWTFEGAAIETNGWNIIFTNRLAPNLDATTAANTNINFFNGFLTNGTPSITNGITLTWTDMGFLDTGAGTTRESFSYGTRLERNVTPRHTNFAVIPINTTNALVYIALSHRITSLASNITVSIRNGAIATTNGVATNCMATNFTVFNGSTQPYNKVGGNWSPGTPMFSRITNGSVFRAVGFHSSMQDRRPIELCRFIYTGLTSGVKVTNNVTEMSVDRTFNSRVQFSKDINPAEFISIPDLSVMTTNEIVRADLQMYCKRGSNVLDTTANTFPVGHPRECAIENRYDPSNNHSRVVFVVDSVLGNDSNGRSRTNVDPTSISSSEYFLTIGAALNNAAGSNNTFYGHNDTSGVIGYCLSCTNYPGVNITATTIPSVEPIIRVYPGTTNQVLTHVIAGSSASMKRIKFEGINTAWASATVPFSSYGHIWFDGCTNLTSISTAPIQNTTNVVITHSTVGSFAQGLRASSAQITAFSLRGVWLRGFNQVGSPRTWIGNYHGDTNDGPGYTIVITPSGDLSPDGNRILYNNFLGGGHQGTGVNTLEEISNIVDVCSIIQNVIEKCQNGQPAAAIASATASGVAYTNVLFVNNVVEGGRIADYGSDSGSAVVPHVGFTCVNNIWAYPGQKNDTDGTPDANRIGSWEPCHMVDGRGNFYIRNNVALSTTSFRPMFQGLNTYEPGYTNIDNYVKFVDRRAALNFSGAGATLGDGSYWLLQESPVWKLECEPVLKFDIKGIIRKRSDGPGPYSSGNPNSQL